MNTSTFHTWRRAAAALFAVAVIALLLVRHHEIHGENLYYWFFARVLLETGSFPVFDRSPISAVFLAPFQLFDFPISVKLEYVIRSAILFAALFTFTRIFTGPALAALAALLWLPFLEDAAGFGQGVGLALIIFGLAYRLAGDDRRQTLAVFYALVLTAYLFRVTFLPMLAFFVCWDLFVLFRDKRRQGAACLIPRPADWPLLVPVAVCAFSLLLQWDHPWNNVYAASTHWMPIANPKSLGEANTFQLINFTMVLQKFGSTYGRDWYVTNKEFFGDMATASEMLRANLPLIATLVDEAIPDLLAGVTRLTLMPRATHADNLVLIGYFSVTLLVFCAALRQAARSVDARGLLCLFVLGCVATMLPQLLGGGWVQRHYGATVPVFIMAGLYVGGAVMRVFDRNRPVDPLVFGMLAWLAMLYLGDRMLAFFAGERGLPLVPAAAVAVFISGIIFVRYGPRWGLATVSRVPGLVLAVALIMFCDPASQWPRMTRTAVADAAASDLRILENRLPDMSPQLVFRAIHPDILACKGILAMDHLFYASFLPLPIDRFYGIQDIPPISKLDDPGIEHPFSPDKVDCLLISESFRTVEGSGVSIGIRYRNYVKPYEEKLLAMGAEKRPLPGYGDFVILKH